MAMMLRNHTLGNAATHNPDETAPGVQIIGMLRTAMEAETVMLRLTAPHPVMVPPNGHG